mmetsp:Transcript_12823/g.42825  ORF Transcript_12823/g.42825 Transcript_12823/m.42825 type:complete len:278 (+) Transcript_12823:340-1173(+)
MLRKATTFDFRSQSWCGGAPTRRSDVGSSSVGIICGGTLWTSSFCVPILSEFRAETTEWTKRSFSYLKMHVPFDLPAASSKRLKSLTSPKGRKSSYKVVASMCFGRFITMRTLELSINGDTPGASGAAAAAAAAAAKAVAPVAAAETGSAFGRSIRSLQPPSSMPLSFRALVVSSTLRSSQKAYDPSGDVQTCTIGFPCVAVKPSSYMAAPRKSCSCAPPRPGGRSATKISRCAFVAARFCCSANPAATAGFISWPWAPMTPWGAMPSMGSPVPWPV